MEPIKIDISTATAQELYAECLRLGIREKNTASAAQMRIQLRLYARRQKAHAYELGRWTLFAQHLGLEITVGQRPRDVEMLAYNHLYERLVTEGYVSADFTGKPLRDPADGHRFYVTGRLDSERVSLACPRTCKGADHYTHGDSCSVWFAAGCVFTDVAAANLVRQQWESEHSETDG